MKKLWLASIPFLLLTGATLYFASAYPVRLGTSLCCAAILGGCLFPAASYALYALALRMRRPLLASLSLIFHLFYAAILFIPLLCTFPWGFQNIPPSFWDLFLPPLFIILLSIGILFLQLGAIRSLESPDE